MDLTQLVSRLEEDIALARRKPRERLVEEELVAEFDAKKHVVRQALAELERMGLVERKRNKGALVRHYSAAEIRQIYAVREVLETNAAEQIPLPAAPELIAKLREVQDRHNAAVKSHDIVNALHANIAFHAALFEACGNPYLAEAISQLALKSHGIRFYSLMRVEFLERARSDHEAMIDALIKGDRTALVTLCKNHIQPSAQAYIEATQPMAKADFY